jgi:hypothetical protein
MIVENGQSAYLSQGVSVSEAHIDGGVIVYEQRHAHSHAILADLFTVKVQAEKPLEASLTIPHRGIETITYVTEGDVEHGDSLGNTEMISSGDVQWMTAGSGIIHQEMPKGDANGAMHGFQLWANLPAAQKMMAPRYRGITADQIPAVELENGVQVKVIAGSIGGAKVPMDDIVIDPEYFDCTVPTGQTFTHETDPAYTAFIYVIGGKGSTDSQAIENETLVLFDAGDHVGISAANEPLRLLLLTGKPLNEPVAWRGPIVMNTQAELETAFREYHEGTFIKNQ